MRKCMWHMEIREEAWSAQRRVGSNQIEMRGDWSNWPQMIDPLPFLWDSPY